MTTRSKPAVSRLRRWRFEQEFTLEEVADLAGLSVSMISRVERGERQLRPETRVRVARRLGVRVADIFEPEAELDDEGEDGAVRSLSAILDSVG